MRPAAVLALLLLPGVALAATPPTAPPPDEATLELLADEAVDPATDPDEAELAELLMLSGESTEIPASSTLLTGAPHAPAHPPRKTR